MHIVSYNALVCNCRKCQIDLHPKDIYSNTFSKKSMEPDAWSMQPYIPHLSHHAAPLRELVKKKLSILLAWKHEYSIPAARNTYVQGSQHILAVVPANMALNMAQDLLNPDGKPIPFTLKSLTDAETSCYNIERELLAVVYACEHFHTYLHCQSTEWNNHKSLEMVTLKNLTSTLPCVQWMLLQLKHYNATIRYRWSSEEQLMGALTRLSSM